jgi:prepilin-type N-terminal cleavage/methylation domain-containing protein
MRQMNQPRNEQGFSMLEVLIAICLLTIAMMGLITLQSRGIRGNDLGNRTTQAIALAQDKLEELINESRSQTITAGADNNINETGTGSGIFTRSWTVQNDTPVTNAQTVSVTMTWNDLIGQHTVTETGVITADAY